MLKIDNLHAKIEDIPILKGLSLEIKAGEIHAVMGPNGAGKSTLAKLIAGHPSYEVTQGSIWFEGKNLLELEPQERLHAGVFMSFQYPPEIGGVSNDQFLYQAHSSVAKAKGEPLLSKEDFEQLLSEKMALVRMKGEFKHRNVNEGFSGGEKKRNEILQMAVLAPKFAILDETDSGLDIDAMRIVSEGVNGWMSPEKGLLLITHYQRLLDYIRPDFVHVLMDGKIIQTGGADLAKELELNGYEPLRPHA